MNHCGFLGQELKGILLDMLKYNPKERISAYDVLQRIEALELRLKTSYSDEFSKKGEYPTIFEKSQNLKKE